MKYIVKPVYFTDEEKAQKVLSDMKMLSALYGRASVGDLYDCAKVARTSPKDDDYGWTRAMLGKGSVCVSGTTKSWTIIFPNPIPLVIEEPEKLTYRDKLAADCPNKVCDQFAGGCEGCPADYGYGPECCGNKHCLRYQTNEHSYEMCEQCWNKEYKGEKKEMATATNNFKKGDLTVGCVVKLRNGQFRMIMPVGRNSTLILTDGDGWNYLSSWDDNLRFKSGEYATGYPSKIALERAKDMDIVAVYGHIRSTSDYRYVGRIDNGGRPLLWERVDPKKMTVADIEKALGYEVEIVSEDK